MSLNRQTMHAKLMSTCSTAIRHILNRWTKSSDDRTNKGGNRRRKIKIKIILLTRPMRFNHSIIKSLINFISSGCLRSCAYETLPTHCEFSGRTEADCLVLIENFLPQLLMHTRSLKRHKHRAALSAWRNLYRRTNSIERSTNDEVSFCGRMWKERKKA